MSTVVCNEAPVIIVSGKISEESAALVLSGVYDIKTRMGEDVVISINFLNVRVSPILDDPARQAMKAVLYKVNKIANIKFEYVGDTKKLSIVPFPRNDKGGQ